MPDQAATFDTPHNEAFRTLGALEPGQQWSAFDVPRDDARKGKASVFVSTIWNFHSTLDKKGHRTPTERAIAQDITDGSYWYRVSKPPAGATRKTWVAHWNGLELSLANNIPIVGVLKDVHTSRCSIRNVFDCVSARSQADGSAIWLELRPRADVGCEVRRIDVRQITMPALTATTLAQATAQFDEAIHEALQRSSTERRARLAVASRLPKRIEVTTTVFERNADVVAEVLLRAQGKCESCANAAPFMRRSDGSPYLEVHHRTRLADGGEDTVENALALCPNCHRGAHYG